MKQNNGRPGRYISFRDNVRGHIYNAAHHHAATEGVSQRKEIAKLEVISDLCNLGPVTRTGHIPTWQVHTSDLFVS